jgi:hypothetical protein
VINATQSAPMQRYLETLQHVAARVRPALKAQKLEVITGSWLGSSALKIQKSEWTNAPQAAPHAEIFFSIWVDEKGLKKNRAFYNIHAFRLRNWTAYRLQSREFATAFRFHFAKQKSIWPNVSLDHGPQTLMQGWIDLNDPAFEETALSLVTQFIPSAKIIDSLLAARKAA